jgi:hypothetical protein
MPTSRKQKETDKFWISQFFIILKIQTTLDVDQNFQQDLLEPIFWSAWDG